MKKHVLFLTLFSFMYFSVSAQADSFQQDIIDYLNINGTYEKYDEAYENMFNVLKPQFEGSNVPESVWNDLKKNREAKVQEIISFLTYAYRKHFTHEEILTMKAFYETEAGKQYVANPGELTETQNGEVTAFFKTDLGQKIGAKRPELAQDIAPIYQDWSKDMFKETLSALIKLGYTTKY